MSDEEKKAAADTSATDDTAADETKEEVKEEAAAEAEAPKEEEKKEEAPAEDLSGQEKKEEAPAEAPKEEEAPAEEEGADVEVPEKFKSIVESIEEMSVLDLNELVKLFEKKFGVSAAAVAVAGDGAAAGGGEAEEKSEFKVELTAAGDQKIAVIKAVKAALNLGLKEAKEMVDGAPAVLQEAMPKEEAEALKVAVEEAGGTIELK